MQSRRATPILSRPMGALSQMRLVDFLEAVAAKTPTPGGGSVSAAACAMGSALGIMAARFSDGDSTNEGASQLEELKGALAELVDADAEAYNLVVAAYRLPKETEEGKVRRSGAVQNALGEAAEVPLKGMQAAVRALTALGQMAPHVNRNLASDLATAAYLLDSGLNGCEENVRINAGSMKDRKQGARLRKEAAALGRKGKTLRARILRAVKKSNGKK